MLFKNLILATLIAGQALASPFAVSLNIHTDEKDVSRVLFDDLMPVEKVIAILDEKSTEVEGLTAGLLDLEDSDGMKKMTQDLRTFSRSLYRAAKDLPSEHFDQAQTAVLLRPFAGTVETLAVLSEIVVYKNETIIALDSDAKFAQRLAEDRNAWLSFYKGLQATLYKCDVKEKRNGCVGQTPFNKGNAEIGKLMLRAIRAIRPSKEESLLSERLDL